MIFHPFLISIYAVVGLLSENISEVSLNVASRLLVVLILATASLLVLLRTITKDWERSGLILSFLLMLFYTYGHVYIFLNKEIGTVGGLYFFRHRFLIVIWVAAALIGILFINRTKNVLPLTQFANISSIAMLLFPVYNIISYTIEENVTRVALQAQPQTFMASANQSDPDVYFIVLDAYGRADVLQELFDLDNSDFIDQLQHMGFYVASCSQSNYAHTRLSLASTLNMDYIQNFDPALKPDSINIDVKPYLVDSQVRSLFENLGYSTVAFYTEFQWLNWQDADYFMKKSEGSSLQHKMDTAISPFEELFLNTTMASALIDFRFADTHISSASVRRDNTLFTLKSLPETSKIQGPKFVYAHLILPHQPFIFGPNGEETDALIDDLGEDFSDAALQDKGAYQAGYRNQVLYANRRLIPILQSLIDESSIPPIIILESDHGPSYNYAGSRNRMSNLIAYYFPGKDTSNLAYPTITPVNSFRLVFNAYFDGDFPLLEDVSYFSKATSDFDFEIIPNICDK
jgi:hypothetical protein